MCMKLSVKEEDYLETIYRLSRHEGYVRISEIARARGVRLPTVISAISRLKENALVRQEYYGKVSLTPTGKKMGAKIYKTHRILRIFFDEVLGLPYEMSEENACRMEHGANREIVRRLEALTEAMLLPGSKSRLNRPVARRGR